MRILFLDKNHPSRFRTLIPYLLHDKNNEVVFLSEYHRKEFVLPGAKFMSVRFPKVLPHESKNEQTLQTLSRRSEAFAEEMLELKHGGFFPDLIISNASSGCSLHVPDIFKCPHVGYFEWYFLPETDENFHAHGYDEPDFGPLRMRNLFQLGILEQCQERVISTNWQKQSYPVQWQDQLKVLHEGVDTDFFSPSQTSVRLCLRGRDVVLGGDQPLITYVSRTLSHYSGFETFIRSLPPVLEKHPDCQVLIVARPTPLQGALPDLVKLLPSNRVHWMDLCAMGEYRAILQASTAHVFLTAPMVLPTSLLEAMSCGCMVAASSTGPVLEVIKHQENGLLSDFWDPKALADNLNFALTEKKKAQAMRKKARSTILEQYNSHTLVPQHLALLQRCINAGLPSSKALKIK